MIMWKDGASIWSKSFPQSVGQAPVRVEYAKSPALDMDSNGNAYLVYHRNEEQNLNRENSFFRTFDTAAQTWQDERDFSFNPSTITMLLL